MFKITNLYKTLGLLLVSIFSVSLVATSNEVSALSSYNINVSVDAGGHSTSSYPLDTITVNVQITPTAGDLYKEIAIQPIISKNDPSSSWGDDLDVTSEYKSVYPTTTDPVTISFQQQLITRGANYIGCIAVRDDYDLNNEESYTICDNHQTVIYTGTLLPVWRFYSAKYSSHFYTTSHAEKMQLENNDDNWKYEKPAYKAHISQSGQSGNVALYRFWSKTKKSHFYTANASERDQVIKNYSDDVWKYEKVAFYVQRYNGSCPAGTSAIYRFWSKTKQSHFYTKSSAERDEVIQKYSDDVWKYEGPKFCAW